MKADDPLAKLLLGLAIPPIDPVAGERALHRATVALLQAPSLHDIPDNDAAGLAASGFWRSVAGRWTMAAMLAAFAGCASLLCLQVRPRDQVPKPESLSVQAERRILQQTETLFGAQLDAVIVGGTAAPEIRLGPDDAPSTAGLAQPVVIEFSRAGHTTVRALGFSGRSVCLTLSGQPVCFEPLVTGRGEVILSGQGFCGMPGRYPANLAGYTVTARPLGQL